MKFRTSAAALAAATLLFASCAPHRAPAAQPAPGAGAAEAQQRPAGAGNGAPQAPRTIAAVTASSRAVEGLFTLYQDTVNGSVHMAIREDQLDREYIYFTQTHDGVLAAGHFRGAYRGNRVFSVRRHFNRIDFVVENTSFHFDPANALARAASANISPSLVSSQEIVAQDRENGIYLVKVDDVFLSEAFHQVKPSPNPAARPGGFSLGTLSRSKTRYLDLRSYPQNTDLVVQYVYDNPTPTSSGDPGVTDPRSISITMYHSLIAMPENGYQPRFDDPRVGYFTQQVTDLTSPSATPYRDLVNRWSLVKRDPDAAISEPVEPIVWWIENTTPHEFRETIRDATLRWNDAFEPAGFRNAIEVRVQPDDADWDAGDVRYNVLRWTSSPAPPFGGYGPSFVNPRTGQILGADVMLEFVFVTNRVRYEGLFGSAALSHMLEALEAETGHTHDGVCSLGLHLQHGTLLGVHALRAAGAGEIEINDLIQESLYYLVLHEVGHTLGLNHNMKASQMLTPAQLTDRALTERIGNVGSVMEYPAINVAPPGQPQGMYYTTRPGPYDHWAIAFAYSPALDDESRMREHLALSTRPELVFGNDADDMRSPGKAIDPRVNTGDLSSDAIGYAVDRFALVNQTMNGLLGRLPTEGSSYHELRNAYLILTGEMSNQAHVISRYIGGVEVDRAMVGQPGATRPFTPVSRAEQRRAMQALERNLFAPDAFAISEQLASHLQMQRRGFNFFSSSEDPKIHARALNIQRGPLMHVLHPVVLTRITDSRIYGNEYPVAEMMGDLTRAIFAADLRGNVNTFRQNLQLEYVQRLISIGLPAGSSQYDAPSRAAAQQNLRSIQRMLSARPSANAETNAHTQHLIFTIRQAFENAGRSG